MIIMASADIRLKYNDVVEKCKETGQPIYLTKNGQGELVVMDIASFEKKSKSCEPSNLFWKHLPQDYLEKKTIN